MQVARLVAPKLDGEDHTKDIDFTSAGIRATTPWSPEGSNPPPDQPKPAGRFIGTRYLRKADV